MHNSPPTRTRWRRANISNLTGTDGITTISLSHNPDRNPLSPNPKRPSATPAVNMRRVVEPPSTSLNSSFRCHSLDKPPQDSDQDLLSQYENLKSSYKQLQEQNKLLKSLKELGTDSMSTVQYLQTENPKLQFAVQAEQLYELLSTLNQSMQTLMAHSAELQTEVDELRKNYNHLKFNMDVQDPHKDPKLTHLQDSLNKTTEELKFSSKEKKQLENSLRDSEHTRRQLEAELKAKQAKLAVLEGKHDSENLNTADLYQKLNHSNQLLAHNEKKIARYEKYIQTNLNKKRKQLIDGIEKE